ncbi:solute carrier family 2 member 11, like [Mastacembelus armatus]|uniref:solute carrier family 2 member 11, like n=1 Tax=Mastacembelus armatus TaxID=205130 RepID=UPI001436B8A0|nr:solute carrier family 2, facilitated glucose transporter member 9-like [Mastacembelus armatus]
MTSPSPFIKELVNRTCLQRYSVSLKHQQLSLIWSFIVSIYCIGGLVGSLAAAPLVSKFGRKRCLLLNNLVAILGAVLMLFSHRAMSFEMIMVGRFLYGINSGAGILAHSMYIVECAPKQLRGMVGVTIGNFISLGKVFGQLLGLSELLGTEEMWPWLLSFSGVAALLQFSTLPFLPESPSFLLLNRGDQETCEKALKRLRGNKDYGKEVEEMLEERTAHSSHSVMELIQNQALRWQLLTIIIVFITLQLCGINAVYFYSFEVFSAAGIQESQLRYAALGTGLCELLTSVGSFVIVETTGKKVLLFRGYMGMAVTLVLLTITLYLQTKVSWMPYCSMVLTFLFILFFSIGPAGLVAPLPGELLTQSFKSAGYTIAYTLNWTGLFFVGMLFPILVDYLDYFCFLIFLIFCTICGLFAKFCIPETGNQTALEIAAEFTRMHCKSQKTYNTEQKLNKHVTTCD